MGRHGWQALASLMKVDIEVGCLKRLTGLQSPQIYQRLLPHSREAAGLHLPEGGQGKIDSN